MIPRCPLSPHHRIARLGAGGQGVVWATSLRINAVWEVAFKEYHPGPRTELRPGTLDAMVALLGGLDGPTGAWLCERTAWPAQVVTDARGPCGFLMRRIDPTYLITVRGTSRTAGLEFLLNSDAYLNHIGLRVTVTQRLALLLDLARTLDRLHGLGIVVGDLSPKNVLFRLSPSPTCFLIDCDAMRVHGQDALDQRETPGWAVPAGLATATPQGDAYKFALCVVRLLAGSQDATDPDLLRAFPPDVSDLARRGRHPVSGVCPTPAEWIDPLRTAMATHVPAPTPTPTPAAAPRATPSASWQAPPHVAPTPTPTPLPTPGRGKGVPVTIGALILAAALWFGVNTRFDAADPWSPSTANTYAAQGATTGPAPTWTPSAAATTPRSAPSTQAASARTQARALDAVLSDNDGTRKVVVDAVTATESCSSGRASAAATSFDSAAATRRQLVRDLAAVDVSALPGGRAAVAHLNTAWLASAEADDAFARWARDAAASGCSGGEVPQTAAWDRAADASTRATAAKRAFLSAWQPIVDAYGLTTRTELDL
jgi:hypothetical protein